MPISQETYDYLMQVLHIQHDENTKMKLYLEHQLSLPDNHRMIQDPDEVLKEALNMHNGFIKASKNAISEIKKNQGTPKPTFNA